MIESLKCFWCEAPAKYRHRSGILYCADCKYNPVLLADKKLGRNAWNTQPFQSHEAIKSAAKPTLDDYDRAAQ